MSRSANIPANATEVTFKYGKGIDGSFYVWPARGKWQWEALGNNGEEDSQEKAITSARDWILYDYDPMNDPMNSSSR